MDLFRRKQKLIFWIVTIIIVPSFVLVWGVGGLGDNPQQSDFKVGAVGGKEINYPEFEAFQKRLRAALGGAPLEIANTPGAGTQAEDLYKYLMAYQLLHDAQKAGITASDLQVGTYLENGHPTVAPAIRRDGIQAKERAVDLVCRQMQVTRPEFLKGLREWQTIGNYLDADSNLTAVNDDTVFSFYSLNKSEVVIKRIQFPESEMVKEQAKKEIMARPADELEREARQYAMDHSRDLRYREPARWRFAYVLTPYVQGSAVTEPAEEDIRQRYEQGKSYLYNDAPLTEVHERIASELRQQEVERQTMRNFSVDIDPQLRGPASELSLEELAKLTPLVKYGAVAKDTGAEPLPAAEVVKALPAGSNFQMQNLLDAIESADDRVRDRTVEEWMSGFDLTGRPFKADDGLYRLRLLEYKPSTPAELDDADGKMKPEFYEKAIEDMVGVRAEEIVGEEARKMEDSLRAYFEAKEKNEPAPDAELASQFEGLPTETINYLQIADSEYELGRLPIGDLMGPREYRNPATGDHGQEIIVMVDRRVPSRASFAAETEEIRMAYRNLAQGNFQGDYRIIDSPQGAAAFIQPSPTIMGGLNDQLIKGGLRVNPELLRTGNEG